MNELSTKHTANVADLLTPANQPATDLGEWPRKDTNVFLRWLWRLTEIGYQGWKQRRSLDYGI